MAKDKVRKLLDNLDAEIDQLEQLPEDKRRQLDNLVEKIKTGVSDEEETADDLHDSLAETVAEFEASHPRLTAVVNDIMVTLSNMGI